MNSESFIPVVLVTVNDDTASRVEGLRIGADDYITKPFDRSEMIARVGAMLRIKRLNDHLVSVRRKLEQLSVFDELTGVYNFRHLHTRLQEEFKRAERYHTLLACVVVDIDSMREHNSRGGQGRGDAILRGIAECLKRSVREVDIIARYGGEEFLIVLPSTPMTGAIAVAERIRCEIHGRSFGDNHSDRSTHVTVTMGVATYPSPDVETKEELLRAADAALTMAKREGGNRIGVFRQCGTVYATDSISQGSESKDKSATAPDWPPTSPGSNS